MELEWRGGVDDDDGEETRWGGIGESFRLLWSAQISLKIFEGMDYLPYFVNIFQFEIFHSKF